MQSVMWNIILVIYRQKMDAYIEIDFDGELQLSLRPSSKKIIDNATDWCNQWGTASLKM